MLGTAPIGLADLIVDVVDTGNTLKANGLKPVDHIADISSRLVVNKAAMKMKHARISAIIEQNLSRDQAGQLIKEFFPAGALTDQKLAGGNVQQVIRALIAAKKAKTISLTFREATVKDPVFPKLPSQFTEPYVTLVGGGSPHR